MFKRHASIKILIIIVICLNKQTKQLLKHCKKNKKEKNYTKLLLLLIWCINRSVYFTAKYNPTFIHYGKRQALHLQNAR